MNPPKRFTLRDLPLPSRLVIAMFLITVGIGYFSALVQLHFQHASAGSLLPSAEDTVDAYHGRPGMTQLERLLTANESKPFNGSGTMRNSFTSKSAGWRGCLRKKATELCAGDWSEMNEEQQKEYLAAAEQEIRKERDGERAVLVAWIRSGAPRECYENNEFLLEGDLAARSITEDYVVEDEDGQRVAAIRDIFDDRCVRCHRDGSGGGAGKIPLESWEQLHDYMVVDTTGTGMSLKKLAQSTHVHLLGFALLYGLTGFIVSLTSYPAVVRGMIAPLPLVAQIADISCWWLGRMDPLFAQAIWITGGIVALGLFMQITLSLVSMFGRWGKVVLLASALAACAGGYVVKAQVIDPYLASEQITLSQSQ